MTPKDLDKELLQYYTCELQDFTVVITFKLMVQLVCQGDVEKQKKMYKKLFNQFKKNHKDKMKKIRTRDMEERLIVDHIKALNYICEGGLSSYIASLEKGDGTNEIDLQEVFD